MKKLWIVVTLGIILRIILSLITYHSDMQVFDIAGKLIASGNIFNLYDFSSASAVFNYPPAIYLFHGIFSFLFNILGLASIAQLNLQLLLLKLPYLIFDLLTGVILIKIFDAPAKSSLACTLWLFNPISLYATYMMGQFDIIPTFFVILSIYFAAKNKFNLSALALGVGIAFKLFPIFLVIPMMTLGRSYREKFKLLIIALIPYVLSVAPYLSSQSFRINALFANQSSKSLYATIPVSGGESIILFPVFLLFFYLIIWGLRLRVKLWKLYLTPLLLFFIFTHYHPQWFIWTIPLLIIDLVKYEFKNLIPNIIIFLTWFASLFFFDPSLTVGIFSPVIPLPGETPSVWTLLHMNLDYNISRSLIQTVFVAAALYLITTLYVKREHVE